MTAPKQRVMDLKPKQDQSLFSFSEYYSINTSTLLGFFIFGMIYFVIQCFCGVYTIVENLFQPKMRKLAKPLQNKLRRCSTTIGMSTSIVNGDNFIKNGAT